MLDSFGARTRRVAPGLVRFAAGAAPTDEECTAAFAIVVRLERDLAPGFDVDALKSEVRQLKASMTKPADGFDAPGMVAALIRVLPGRSGAAFSEAVRRVLDDDMPDDFSLVYMPTVPQLIRLTKTVEGEWRVAAERLRRILEAKEDEPPAPELELTPEQRADLDRRIAALGMKVPPPDRPAPVKLDGTSPAARVAAMTAGRKAERLRQAEQAANLGNVLSEDGQLLSETGEQAGNDHLTSNHEAAS